MDKYSKTVLTIIAVALCGIIIQNITSPAIAIGNGCGGWSDPCYITVKTPLDVWIKNRVDVAIADSVQLDVDVNNIYDDIQVFGHVTTSDY